MNYDSHSLSVLFEKCLVRIVADFGSQKDPKSVVSELTKELKTKITKEEASSYNFQLTRSEDGTYHLKTSFLLYRDCRLTLINLLKWIERNGNTQRNHNLFVDLKFLDAEKGPFKGTLYSNASRIENVDKLKFILDFNEERIYGDFPNRKDSFNSQSIQRFDITQKFIPKNSQTIDPRFYSIPSTINCGINFDTLIDGYLRMQYIGGLDYEKKIQEILSALNQFCVTAWNATLNKSLNNKDVEKFKTIVDSKKIIRESYYDYSLFVKNYPKVKFSIDLIYQKQVLETYYQILRDRIYDIFSAIKIKGELELNYDTTISVFQIKEAEIEADSLSGVEFINCKINKGTFTDCDFYNCSISNSTIQRSNLFLNSTLNKCNLFDSFVNRTVKISDCEFEGANGVLNGDMERGIFKNGKVGLFANISQSTTVIEYKPLKSGYFVAGDQIIIPTKKFRQT
jgi:hypothetical protein